MYYILILILTQVSFSSAHQGPQTGPEIEAYTRSQQSLYHCYPVIADYLDARQAAWSSDPSSFIESSQTRLGIGPRQEQHVLSCNGPDLEARIRNQSCVLSPVVTSGPYYHLSGHLIRQNMAEWQDGILFMMDIGVIDVETCEPIPNVLVDVWHANATGFYAGHPVQSPELRDELPQATGKRAGLLTAYPLTVPHETFLRAAWPTNRNGVSQFTSIFPGYYTGRATHVHAKIHLNWTEHSNATFSSAGSAYTGQFFFPDDVNLAIDGISPYRYNPVKDRTRNWVDSLKIFNDSHKEGFEPTFDIKKLGNVLNQGLVGFMTVGIDRRTSLGHEWVP
ncbi:hypothetical protein CROQUDRAFT_662463 [Cronartium quercuum f. sp. fusiforme G11]|uniref:Aromatic compound dioxygenase n=1 Tax=Cronartium quercuum f. sp. fusiforme G11 TaxID=708437 RepID=A0A9P6T7W1_9BASI|nr:hypothetical protein CROQUDRAFT_662463 [Cronartium quercuum f. sp. fusiforme G11]